MRSVADRSIVHFPPQLNAPNHGSSNPFMGEWPCVWRWWTSLLNTCICTVVCRRVCPCFFSNSLYRFIHSMETHEENTAVDSIAKQYVCDRCGRTNFVDGHALGDHKKHCNNKKQCTKCKQTKTFTEFYKDGSKRDGLDSHCKVCRHAEAKQNRYEPDYREHERKEMKQCTKCKQTKAPTEFGKDGSKRDGLTCRCKVCRHAEAKQKDYEPNYSKKKQCITCKQTKAPTEFGKHRLRRDGLNSYCKVCFNAARRKQTKDEPDYREHERKEMKQCTKCKQTKAPTEFGKDGSKRDGLTCRCKVCRHAEAKQKDYEPDYSKKKQCITCKQTKAPTEFGKHRLRRDGLNSYCKVCFNAARRKQTKDEPDYREHERKEMK